MDEATHMPFFGLDACRDDDRSHDIDIVSCGALRGPIRDEWDDVVMASSFSCLGHLSWFQDTMKQSWNIDTSGFYSFVVRMGGRACAVFPFQRHLANTWMLDSQIMFHGGLAVRDDMDDVMTEAIERKAYAYLRNIMLNGSCSAVKVSLPPLATMGSPYNPLLAHGFIDISVRRIMVDLSRDEDEIFRSLRRNHRRNIRKATDSGLSVRLGDNASCVETYYRMHCDTYGRTGVRPHPKRYFECIWEYFRNAGMAEYMFAIDKDGNPVSAATIGIFRNSAHHWTAANYPDGLKLAAQKFLIWEAIRLCKGRGYDYFDVSEVFDVDYGDKGNKLSGLTQVKEGWGEAYPSYKGYISI